MKINSFVLKGNCVVFFLALFALLFSPPSAVAGVWTQYYMVTDVYPASSGDAYFKQETQENPDNCSSSTWYRLKADHASKGEAYAVVLSAIALGYKVRFNLNGCSGSYPVINAVIMDVNQ